MYIRASFCETIISGSRPTYDGRFLYTDETLRDLVVVENDQLFLSVYIEAVK